MAPFFISPTAVTQACWYGPMCSDCGPSIRELVDVWPRSDIRCWFPIRSIEPPNPPMFTDVPSFNFQSDADRAKLAPLTTPLSAPGAVESDAKAYIAFLDAQPQVNKSKKLGVQGYCAGGPHMMRTAAAVPERVGAGASFHGGGLVTDKPDSPHLLAPSIKARLYFAVAGNDDQRQPDAKDKLREAFAAAKVPAEIEVYPRDQHGWCIADMPHAGRWDADLQQSRRGARLDQIAGPVSFRVGLISPILEPGASSVLQTFRHRGYIDAAAHKRYSDPWQGRPHHCMRRCWRVPRC